jgi:hypothetical protein
MGTLEVAAYEFPQHLFDKILYVEKEGFNPIWEAARLGDRYDMAIVSGKGQPVEAVRTLFQRAEEGEYQLFVLHDADSYGYQIAHTLAEATKRMPNHSVEVIDLGLSVADAIERGLTTEQYTRNAELPDWMPERLNEAESEWFDVEPRYLDSGKPRWDCTRVELNALTAPQLVAFVEEGLAANGADTKIQPPADVVKNSVSSSIADIIGAQVSKTLEETIKVLKDRIVEETESQVTSDPEHWEGWITEGYSRDRSMTWGTAIHDGVDGELAAALDGVSARTTELLVELLSADPDAAP